MSSANANVAVFWDYENCQGPSSTSGYAITGAITSVAHRFGVIRLFRAYLDATLRTPVARSELQCSGVSLVDCPHNGRKNVADQMMMVDMVVHALDSPHPVTFIVVSGDRDFSYTLSILRQRKHRVVLVSPSNMTHVSLTSQAAICLDWNKHILKPLGVQSTNFPVATLPPEDGTDSSALRKQDQALFNLGRRPTASTVSSSFPSKLNSSTCQTDASHRTVPGEYAPSIASATVPRLSELSRADSSHGVGFSQENWCFHEDLPGGIATPADGRAFGTRHVRVGFDSADAPSGSTTQRASISPFPLEQGDDLDHILPLGSLHPSPPLLPSSLPSTTVVPSSLPSVHELEDSVNGGIQIPEEKLEPEVRFEPTVSARPIPPDFRFLIDLLHKSEELGIKKPLASLISAQIGGAGFYKRSSFQTFEDLVGAAHVQGYVVTGGSGNERWLSLPEDAVHPSHASNQTPISSSLDVRPRLDDLTTQASSSTSIRPDSTSTSPPLHSLDVGPQLHTSPNSSTSEFSILVDCVRKSHDQGIVLPLASAIAAEISRHLTFNQQSRYFNSFRDLVEQAERAGLVCTGGSDDMAWVALQSNVSHNTPHTLKVIAVPDPVFMPLLKLLAHYRSNLNMSHPLRSSIALDLVTRDPAVYSRAGFKKFKEYSQAAESANLIKMGGDAGAAWISLHNSELMGWKGSSIMYSAI